MKRLVFLLIVSLILVLFTGCAQANDPEENGDTVYLNLVATYETEAYVEEFDVTDDYIYIAEDMAGFSIWEQASGNMLARYDSTLVGNMRLIKVLEESNLLVVFNKYGGTYGGTLFFDITARDNPQYLMSIPGNNAELSCLQVWSINADRFRFSWVNLGSQYYTGEFVRIPNSLYWAQDGLTFEEKLFGFNMAGFDEDLTNERLYCASEELGMKIVDRADFSIVNNISTIGQTIAVKVVDNVAYLGNREEGIQLLDISDELNPVEIFNYDTTGLASDIAVSPELNVFALASTSGGIYLFRGPDGVIERLQRIDDSEIGYTYKVKIHGNYLYAGTRYGIYKFEIINLR
ncbi:MAG: hypothetical protein K9N06_06370 [Candidatus Cloacimonetes bacterium]|nr:hypothetical protein [Candidatus Cloacimonadota bacterium]